MNYDFKIAYNYDLDFEIVTNIDNTLLLLVLISDLLYKSD
jgi:hypothetical protein